jgi:uncharacterized metal-binding protein
MLYLFWWLSLLYYFGIIPYQDWQLWFGVGLFSGMCVADSLHYTVDLLVSDVKRKTRKTKRSKK